MWPNCSMSVLRSDARRTCRDSGPNEGRETAIFFQCQFAATCFVQLLPVHRSPGGNSLIVRDKGTLFSVPELKEAASSDVSNHSSSPSEDEGSRPPLTIHPSISLSTHHLCVLCRTFANDVNMHDLGVCSPPNGHKIASVIAMLITSWYFWIFKYCSKI